jgi:hypothetical protein
MRDGHNGFRTQSRMEISKNEIRNLGGSTFLNRYPYIIRMPRRLTEEERLLRALSRLPGVHRKRRPHGPKREPSDWNRAVSEEFRIRKAGWSMGVPGVHKPTLAKVAHDLSTGKTRRKKAHGEPRKKRSDAGKKRGPRKAKTESLFALWGLGPPRRRRRKRVH